MVSDKEYLPLEEHYLRWAEKHNIPGEGTIQLVICMYKALSELLLDTKQPSIDTSLKRIHKWRDFKIEAWFPKDQHCKYFYPVGSSLITNFLIAKPLLLLVPSQLPKVDLPIKFYFAESSRLQKRSQVDRFNFVTSTGLALRVLWPMAIRDKL